MDQEPLIPASKTASIWCGVFLSLSAISAVISVISAVVSVVGACFSLIVLTVSLFNHDGPNPDWTFTLNSLLCALSGGILFAIFLMIAVNIMDRFADRENLATPYSKSEIKRQKQVEDLLLSDLADYLAKDRAKD